MAERKIHEDDQMIVWGDESAEILEGQPRWTSTRVEWKPGTPQDTAAKQRDRALAAIDGLRQIKNSTGTLTAAQLSSAVRLQASVLLVLLRHAYQRHEEDD